MADTGLLGRRGKARVRHRRADLLGIDVLDKACRPQAVAAGELRGEAKPAPPSPQERELWPALVRAAQERAVEETPEPKEPWAVALLPKLTSPRGMVFVDTYRVTTAGPVRLREGERCRCVALPTSPRSCELEKTQRNILLIQEPIAAWLTAREAPFLTGESRFNDVDAWGEVEVAEKRGYVRLSSLRMY